MEAMKLVGDDGKRVEVAEVGVTNWGDVRIELRFDVGWARGTVAGVCGRQRLDEFASALERLPRSSVRFINEDGNIDITLAPTPTGRLELKVTASPNMVEDQEIELNFAGVLEQTLMTEAEDEVLVLARGMLEGKVPLLDGCRGLASLRPWVAGMDPELRLFAGIESETADLPEGEARTTWEPAALRELEESVANYVDSLREEILQGCQRLLDRFG